MKRFLAIIAVLFLSLAFIGCGDNPDEPGEETKKFTVEFLVDEKVIDTQEVEEGKAATKPEDPTKEGFEFKGWDKDFSKVTSDLKVNAKFEKVVKTFKVEFLVDGKVVDTQTIEEGKAATKPEDPTKDGYTFAGWDKDFSNVTSDLKVNAKFDLAKVYHTVTFTVDGEVYKKVEVEDGTACVLPEQPTKEGLYFAGWRKDTSCVTSDMTVAAKFVEVSLEAKTVIGLKQVGKGNITYFWEGSGIDSNADLYNKHIYMLEGIGGNSWWYQVAINNINGRLEVVEVSPRGNSLQTKVCDYMITAYTDALAAQISATGVQVGDVIEFTKSPSSYAGMGKQEVDVIFRVKREGEITQYMLDSDTAHTVIALHKMGLYFASLGEKISVDKIDLTTLEDGSDGTNATNATIVWTSSNPDIIAIDGTIKLPDTVTEVTLTAVATYETSTYTQTFTVKVSK